jgi:two-component system NarL family response regulator
MGGVEAIRAIRREFPPAKIIVLSTYQGDEEIYRALEVGAATFLIKNMLGEAMMRVIREVTAGGRPILPDVAQRLADRMLQPALTPREIDVLRLIARGQRNKEIAVLVQGTLDRRVAEAGRAIGYIDRHRGMLPRSLGLSGPRRSAR